MNKFKLLLILIGSIGGVATSTVGIIHYKNKGETRAFYERVNKEAKEIEERWKDHELKALRTNDKDEKWEIMYWDKVWSDGWDRRKETDYKNYEKEKWESKFGNRYTTGIVTIDGLNKERIDEIFKDKKIVEKGRKYKEMCMNWYLSEDKNIKSPSSGHVCLYSDDAWPKVEEELKKDIGETLGNYKKEINKSNL